MFKTGDKAPSVRLNDDFAALLEAVAIPATDVGASAEVQKRIGVSRMLDVLPRLFNIGVADINALPSDRRTALVDALRTYFTALGRLREQDASNSSPDAIAHATNAVNALVRGYRDAISATVKSPELSAALRNPHLKPRTLEFTGQRITAMYAMRLGDIDTLPPGDRLAVTGPLEFALQTEEMRADSSNISISQGHIDYSGNYYYDMRAASKDLEHALVAAGLLPKPMLALMRKSGHDKVRDMVLLDRNVTAPMIARGLKDKTDADQAEVYAAMEAFVGSGRLTGEEAKRFDRRIHQMEITA